MTNAVQHPAHLSVPPFVQGQFHNTRIRLGTTPQEASHCRSRRPILAGKKQPARQLGYHCLVRSALDGRVVGLPQALRRMRDLVNKISIIGEEEKSLRVRIQSSRRDQSRARYRDKVCYFLFCIPVGYG